METQHESRNYHDMSMKEMVESVIRDSKVQGTVTIPFRPDGYHTCCNVMYTDR